MSFSLRIVFYIFIDLAKTVLTIQAELPPSAYQELQAKCPEALNIKVESVKIDKSEEPAWTRLSITAQAKVATVTRSASGVKPGDKIQISYTYINHKQPIAGPSEPDILEGVMNFVANKSVLFT